LSTNKLADAARFTERRRPASAETWNGDTDMHYRRSVAPVLLLSAIVSQVAVAAGPATLQMKHTIPLESGRGRYDHLALDGGHDRLFIANLSNNSLDIVDLKAGKLAKQIPGQRKVQGVAYAAHQDRIFVGNGNDGVVNVFDGRDYKLVGTVPVPDADNVRYRADTQTIYVTGEEGLTAMDAKTLKVRATIKLAGPPEGLQIDARRDRLYVNTHNPAQVTVVDLKTHKVVAEYKLKSAESNFPMALDLDGERIFVGCRKKPCVLVLDARTGAEIAAVPIPGDTDDLFFDAKSNRLYATCGEGSIAVVRQRGDRGFELVESIPTAKLARTGLFDPKSGQLFVVVPRQSDSVGPELRVYGVKP
jgi:DNA-binding beta-propeller fold protein YncE